MDMRRFSEQPIDVVIPWVDGSDPAWQAEKTLYLPEEPDKRGSVDAMPARYRDSGTLKYLLRSIEAHLPWVRTVHFVTWGHLPEWMNPEAEGLHIVRHSDYIPEQYLPTFSSHTIELNMHRISGLSEQFIYFNDDCLVLKPTKPTDFFKHGLPVDFAVETVLAGKFRHSICGVQLSNSEIINENFSKHDVIRNNKSKWINLRYGTSLLKTLALLPWPRFSDFSYNHTANPFLKETFLTVWDHEYEALDETCRHRFRSMSDPNQWLMRDWQLVSGRFVPGPSDLGKTFLLTDDLSEIRQALRQKKYTVICINDVSYAEVDDYEHVTNELKKCLDAYYPRPCRFEKQ